MFPSTRPKENKATKLQVYKASTNTGYVRVEILIRLTAGAARCHQTLFVLMGPGEEGKGVRLNNRAVSPLVGERHTCCLLSIHSADSALIKSALVLGNARASKQQGTISCRLNMQRGTSMYVCMYVCMCVCVCPCVCMYTPFF